MRKKKLITMLVSLSLAAVVGIGATLAYLSSTTGELKNTFTVGNGIEIKQDETDLDNPKERTEEGNEYTDIQPGDVLVKDPTVTVKANSTECYVFMKLSGADALTKQDFTFNGFDSSKWIKVDTAEGDSLDGIYRYYQSVEENEEDQVLESLFSSVTYSIDVKEVESANLSDVIIKSCAVQKANMDEEAALEAAKKAMK